MLNFLQKSVIRIVSRGIRKQIKRCLNDLFSVCESVASRLTDAVFTSTGVEC